LILIGISIENCYWRLKMFFGKVVLLEVSKKLYIKKVNPRPLSCTELLTT